MMSEYAGDWRNIPGYPTYIVSSEGDVVNSDTGRWLKYYWDDRGYARVSLYSEGRQKKFYVHQLVALCFVRNYKLGMPLEHRDGDNTNNASTNLRIRKEERTQYLYGGEWVGIRRVYIPETGQIFASAAEAARELGTDASSIYRVLRGDAKTHKGLRFEYVGRQILPYA